MNFEYKDYELSNAITDIAAGPFGSNLKVSCFTTTGFPIIDGANLKEFTVTDNITKFVSEDKARSLHRSIAKRRDVVVTISGNVGQVSYIPDNSQYAEYLCSQRQFRATFDESKIYVPYLVYYLHSVEGQSKILAFANQTGVPALSQPLKNFRKIKINLPSLPEQKKIAAILSALDEKIAINRAINDNLLEQIRTLCIAWLSDYEPFDGVIPYDWVETPLSDIAEFISGYSYKGAELTDSTIAMATIKNFDRKGGFKLDGYKEIIPSSKLKESQHAELFDTLVAHTDLTQNAEVIGNAEPVMSKSGYDDIVFSMDLVKVLPKKESVSKFLIAAILQDKKFKAHCLGYVNGTTVLHLSKKALPEYSLMLPKDLSILVPLDEAVSSMYRQMALNIDENVQLANLRDSLLPQLMSGKLDVSGLDL